MMLKKIAGIVLVVCVMLQFAFAQEDEFSLRGGVKWGMSRDEVIAIEAGSYYDENIAAEAAGDGMSREQFVEDVKERGHAAFGDGAGLFALDPESGLTLLTVDGVRASKYEAIVVFIFFEDRLNACMYMMYEGCDPEYMLAALETKYGEFADDGHDAFIDVMRYITGEKQAKGLSEQIEGKHKLLANGTFIHSILIDGDYAIMYQDTAGKWEEEGYDMSGL